MWAKAGIELTRISILAGIALSAAVQQKLCALPTPPAPTAHDIQSEIAPFRPQPPKRAPQPVTLALTLPEAIVSRSTASTPVQASYVRSQLATTPRAADRDGGFSVGGSSSHFCGILSADERLAPPASTPDAGRRFVGSAFSQRVFIGDISPTGPPSRC